MKHITLAIAAMLAFATTACAHPVVKDEQLKPDDPGWTFKTIPGPSRSNVAQQAKLTLTGSQWEPAAGNGSVPAWWRWTANPASPGMCRHPATSPCPSCRTRRPDLTQQALPASTPRSIMWVSTSSAAVSRRWWKSIPAAIWWTSPVTMHWASSSTSASTSSGCSIFTTPTVAPAIPGRRGTFPRTLGATGTLPASQAGLSVSNPGTLVTAFGRNPDGAGTVLRVWDQTGVAADLTIILPAGVKSVTATPVNLRGEKVGVPVRIAGGRFSTHIMAYAPASFVLES